MVSVYAITSSRDVPELPGVRIVRVGTLAALVTDTRRPPAPTAMNLRRYHHTLAAIADAVPATLPARFGTTLTEPELALILHMRSKSLADTLRRVRGRVQMTIRLTGTPKRKEDVVDLPAKKTARSGREYLRAQSARERDLPGFDVVRDVLGRWIEEERVERRSNVVSVYHLVPRRAAAAYARTAAAAIAAAGLRGIVSGPFPPYAFSGW
jgi:hypothetical protein